jgi:hypothetical protein
LLAASLFYLAGCGGNPCTSSTDVPTLASPPTGNNVMQITVNGSLCSGVNNYANEPCASVTICDPATPTNCVTINNILVDTGSFGLRVFQSELTSLGLTQEVLSPGNNIAECVTFGDGSSEWGPVATANITIGGETAQNVPIQMVNSTYATPPAACNSENSVPDTDPSEAGFNGILGVGLLAQDCGTSCQTVRRNGQYYTCNAAGTICTEATVPNSSPNQQVTNPISMLPTDNNGILMELPSVNETCGAASATGYMVFGVATETNNNPNTNPNIFPNDTNGTPTVFGTDQYGNISTVFTAYQTSPMTSFVDSGSSDYFIPPPGSAFPDCSDSEGQTYEGFYCPSSNTGLSAVNTNASGTSVTGTVNFNLNNAYNLLTSGNAVFSNIAGLSGTGNNAFFDYGLPFFYGRTVAFGITGQPGGLAAPPYVAY